ncbi:hypothetical protein DFQ29_003139 [Apophysomyces sp. BC1021]|nr:hypothetical protein DFQ29_003139 [Apophysomyces sp. BC1021]
MELMDMEWNKEDLTYTSCYCEENIYLLCKKVASECPALLEQFSVLFISNASKTIPMWIQRASSDGYPVVWDYHVVLYHRQSRPMIYDFDTRLPFLCPADKYIIHSFQPHLELEEKYKRCFRVVPASTYLREFASDRTHMLKEGKYLATPPAYPPIASKDETMNLMSFVDMATNIQSEKYGMVMNEDSFFDAVATKTL